MDPFDEPARYPLRIKGPQPPAQVVAMTAGGDLMLGRRVGAASARAGDVSRPLRAIGPRLKAPDLTVVNLESTLSTAGEPQQGGDSFAAPPGVVAGLRDVGIDVVSLANNHTGDFQRRALVETVRLVKAGGLQPVGAGSNLQEAARPVIVTRDGVRFGFLAFNAIGETPRATATTPGVVEVRMPPRTGPLNQGDLAAVTRAIRALKTSVDVVAVLPHWGQQYTHDPVPAQRAVAAALTTAGADLVIGGHPHWVQAVEFPAGKVVAHSLGNLVFDMDFAQQTREGVLLELTYWGKTLKAARLTPYVIGADFGPRVVTGTRAEQILADLRSAR
ncbi:CapA family protein [Kribbella amoyensis]|uniref:CapA family protein n=1 Tax=Kribbella amoyensis TaxID=996641 RepID=UPI0014790C7F|nr:CapA family protein [Kribbella amoyensis]